MGCIYVWLNLGLNPGLPDLWAALYRLCKRNDIYIYIYIYICVCVCVCVCFKQAFVIECFPCDLHVLTFKFSCFVFFSYVGIQMIEKVSNIYPIAFSQVSGRLQRNYWFLVLVLCEFYLFGRFLFCFVFLFFNVWSIQFGGLQRLNMFSILMPVLNAILSMVVLFLFLMHINSRIYIYI